MLYQIAWRCFAEGHYRRECVIFAFFGSVNISNIGIHLSKLIAGTEAEMLGILVETICRCGAHGVDVNPVIQRIVVNG